MERRLHPEPIGEVVTDLLVDHFGALRRPRVHRPDGGGARRGRPRRARRGSRCCASSTARSKELVDEKRASPAPARLHDRGDRTRSAREGHPMVIRLGPQRRVPGLLALPGAQGVAAAARARRSDDARSCPASARPARSAARPMAGRSSPSAAGSGRSSAARAIPTATTSRRTARRRPTRCPFEVVCPRCKEGRLTPRRARRTGLAVLGLLALPEVRLHDARTSRSVRSTTPTAGPSPARARTARCA